MTNSGKFTTFNPYMNDLMMAQSGLYEIIPSKFIVIDANYDVEKQFNNIVTSEDNDAYHTIIRSKMYEQFTPSDINGVISTDPQQFFFGTIISSGDINMLSHDFKDGIMYNEIYVHVNGEDAIKRTVMLAERNVKEPCFEVKHFESEGANKNIVTSDSDKTISFNAVLVLYNVWNKVDKTLKYADVPMGIYRLSTPQTLYVSKESNFGSGTSWATRISLASPFTSGSVQTEDQSTTYNTMASVISKLGECINGVQNIVSERVNNLEEIKSKLAEFKNHRHVNVPYMVGDSWYVNGRYIKKDKS